MMAAGFRCPQCGQAHEMVTAKYTFTMDKEMTKILVDDIDPTGGIHITWNEEVTCKECSTANDIQDWVTAFEDPLMFFDMEQLCHCGGELWMDQIPGTRNYGFVCEKCNWVKPKAVVNGG